MIPYLPPDRRGDFVLYCVVLLAILLMVSWRAMGAGREPYVCFWAECPDWVGQRWEGCRFGEGSTPDIIRVVQNTKVDVVHECGPESAVLSKKSELYHRVKAAKP